MISYHNSLKEFKKSLLDGSENKIILDIISKFAPSNRLRWLDLGIGSGNFSFKLIRALKKEGFDIFLTGVDIDKDSLALAKDRFPKMRFIKSDFSRLKLKEKFDIIYLSQSLYYAKNKTKLIANLLEHLSEGGLLIVVLWSKEDSLYKLFRRVYNKNKDKGYTSEKAYDLLKEFKNFQIIKKNKFYGRTNFKYLRTSIRRLKSLHRVISRIAVVNNYNTKYLKLLKGEIVKFDDCNKRVNGIILAKKKYDIPQFNRKNITRLLKKRFPSYLSLVSKLRGDLEALFMASWEKETRYLSNLFPPGRVLEICCAAGCKSIILAKRHKVVAIDKNLDRINAAKYNAKLFGCIDKICFINDDASKSALLKTLGKFSAIYVDADWRENLGDPIKKQNRNPFKTTPRTDKLYKTLRRLFPNTPIIFKVSPFVKVKDMQKLGKCKIEELYISGKFLSYNVYYSPKIKNNEIVKLKL